MEKIILSKNILKKGHVNSFFIYPIEGKQYSNEKKMIKDFGLKEVVKRLFDEDIESDNLSEAALYQLYSEILTNDKEEGKWFKENDKFIELYKINDEFALQLDFNIHLYHLLQRKESYMRLVPWYYADSKMYVGDCWGDQDDEIIENIQKLSFIDFLKTYKGY